MNTSEKLQAIWDKFAHEVNEDGVIRVDIDGINRLNVYKGDMLDIGEEGVFWRVVMLTPFNQGSEEHAICVDFYNQVAPPLSSKSYVGMTTQKPRTVMSAVRNSELSDTITKVVIAKVDEAYQKHFN